MLIEKINNCTASINELSALRTAALNLGTYETSINKLTTVATMVADFVSTVDEMNKHNFCKVTISAEELTKMREAIITCAAAVNDITLNGNNVVAISTLFQSQKTMLTMLWQSTAKAYVEPIRSYLGIIQTFASNKEEISNMMKALATGSTAEPNAAIVKTLVANAQKANAITSNFQMSDGVRAFLQKAKNGKATYADITHDVAEWIAEHDLGSKIKISF